MQYDNGSVPRMLGSGSFLTGLAVGGLLTLVLTNPNVQRALFRSVAKAATMINAGVAEAKERFHDAEAEVQHEAEIPQEGAVQHEGDRGPAAS